MNKKIFYLAILTLICDQLVKVIIDLNFRFGQSVSVIKNIFYITNYHNHGAAWGLLNNQVLVIIIATLILGAVIYRFMYCFKSNWRNTLAFGLLIGGLAGNLLDRLFFGYVRDFIDLRVVNFYYPIFNIADIALVTSVVLLIIAIIKGEDLKNGAKSRKK